MMLLKNGIKGILFLCVISVVFSMGCRAESENIKEKIEYTYILVPKFDKYESILMGKWIHTYAEQGNETEETVYNSEGRLEGKIIFRYDEKGNEIWGGPHWSDAILSSLDWLPVFSRVEVNRVGLDSCLFKIESG